MQEFSTASTDLERRLRRLEAPEPAPGLAARLRTVPELAAATPGFRPASWRTRFVLATSGAGLAVGLGMLLMVLTSRSAPAFTRVVEALQGIRTVTWEQTSTTYLPGENRGRTLTSRVWVRTEPATYVERRADGSRTLMDASGTRNFTPPDYYSQWSLPPDTDLGRQNILYHVVSPAMGIALPEARWETSRTQLDGEPALRYTRELRWGGDELPASFPAAERYQRRNVDTVWVDPASLRILRREHRQFDTRDDRLQNLIVAHRFRYNEVPWADTFTWKVPAGKEVQDVTSRPLAPEVQAACAKAVERAEAAWSAGDFTRFAALWDFEYLSRIPPAKLKTASLAAGAEDRREAWERLLMARQRLANPWTRWKSEVMAGYWVRVLLPFGSLPPLEPELVKMDARGSVVQADGSEWPVQSAYYLRREGAEWKLVHWRYDLPEEVLGGP